MVQNECLLRLDHVSPDGMNGLLVKLPEHFQSRAPMIILSAMSFDEHRAGVISQVLTFHFEFDRGRFRQAHQAFTFVLCSVVFGIVPNTVCMPINNSGQHLNCLL